MFFETLDTKLKELLSKMSYFNTINTLILKKTKTNTEDNKN